MTEDDTQTFNSTVYYDEDADGEAIAHKTVAVLGYGSQGHAHAQNLNDSGVDVVVGLREDSSSWDAAESDGLRVEVPADAVAEADIVSVLVPDTVQPDVYENAIEPNLDAGDTLQFAHGFNIHYNQIQPPEDVDVTMVAPKSPGHLVRRNYENDEGTPGLLAVYQDATGDAHDEGLAYAAAIGCTRAGVVETSFREETETDLFGEQAVLCGGVTSLVKQGYETLVDAGYPGDGVLRVSQRAEAHRRPDVRRRARRHVGLGLRYRGVRRAHAGRRGRRRARSREHGRSTGEGPERAVRPRMDCGEPGGTALLHPAPGRGEEPRSRPSARNCAACSRGKMKKTTRRNRPR